jgi:TPR repeat protein
LGSPYALEALLQEESEDTLPSLVGNLKPDDIPTLVQKAGAGDRQSQVILGWAYFAGSGVAQDYFAAAKWLQAATDQGSGLAACGLGNVYTLKRGPGQDYAKAMTLYRKSADRGQACGEFNVGMMYENGEGVPQDSNEAVKWYLRAAARNGYYAGKAQQFLGDMYFQGAGVKKDYRRAARWYTSAEQSGVAEAEVEFRLGMMYAEGIGVKKDPKESDSWFLKAAEHGNTKAQLVMGTGYLEDKRYDEAAKWIRRAADSGDAEAQDTLAGIYSHGEGVEQSDAQALEWAKKSAEQGNGKGAHDVGFFLCCKSPSTIQQDEAVAYMWFLIAYQAGDEKATTFLAALQADLNGGQIGEARKRANDWLAAHGKSTLAQDPVAALMAESKSTKKNKRAKRASATSGSESNGQSASEGPAQIWAAGESTPGAELFLKEVRREKLGQNYGDAAGKTGITYNLVASGLPKGPTYTLWIWTLGTDPRPATTGFSVDDSGKVICLPAPEHQTGTVAAKWCEQPLESMNITVTAARGEPKRFALMTDDFKVRSFAKTIPFPIEAKDGPCRLSVEMAEPVGQAFEIRGEGFQPNEDVEVIDKSEDEVMRLTQKASTRGEVGGAEFPAVAGKSSGAASWSAQSKSCHVKVDYNWGKAAFEWQ